MLAPTIRRAVEADLPTVVRLFAIPDEGIRKDEDPREPLDPRYAEALASMAGDPDNGLFVAVIEGVVVGAFQLTIIQQISHRGGRLAQIESVIVDPAMRGRSIGESMMRWAIGEARRRACFRVQLTSNNVRERAHGFYRRLGFVGSHVGMKLVL